MIDFQKTKVYGVNHKLWLDHSELNFKGEFDIRTSVVSHKEEAIYLGLKFIIYYDRNEPQKVNSMWVHGSLHKYWNFLNGITAPNQWNDQLKSKGYNGNAYTYLDFLRTLNDLEQRFGIDFERSTLHGFEYGLNINHNLNSGEVLDGVIMHYGTLFNPERSKYKYLLRAEKYQMQIKVYDKGLQYGELNETLRFEKKVTKMECIDRLDISSLNDLRNIQKWEDLKNDLLKCWNDILYIDNILDTSSFTEAELLAMKDFKNRNFWSAIKSNRRSQPKARYKAIERKHKGKTRDTIRKGLESSYFDLVKGVRIDSSSKWSNITQLRIIDTHYGLTA